MSARKKTKPQYRGKTYEVDDAGTWHWRSPQVRVLLANFKAHITEDVLIDDGVDQKRAFQLSVTIPGKAQVPLLLQASQFNAMNWPLEYLGAGAVLHPSAREHMRAAIQMLSTRHTARVAYQHTGWKETSEHGPIFLHADGAIGGRGALPRTETRLSEALNQFRLPAPNRQAAIEGIRASLEMLDCAPLQVTLAPYAAIWRAILGQPLTFTLHLSGTSGFGKTEIAALCQQHFGAGMHAKALPGSWQSTTNANVALAFQAKDTLFVVDDFVPAASMSQYLHQQAEADRLIRSQGNNAGRARMNRELQIQVPKPPRALLLSTGEDIPRGHSLRARMIVVEFDQAVDWQKLTHAQANARQGLYAAATAGFIRWLAPKLKAAQRAAVDEVQQFRLAITSGSHRRNPDNVAEIAAGFRLVLTYAREINAISEVRANELWSRAGDAFNHLINQQRIVQQTAEPGRAFVHLCASAITSGRAHLAARDGRAPEDAVRWGYRVENDSVRAQGEKIGWTEANSVYLEPMAALAVAKKMGRDQGEHLALSVRTLGQRLKQDGLLASMELQRGTVTIRFRAEEKRNQVFHFAAEQFESVHSESDNLKLEMPAFTPYRLDAGQDAENNATSKGTSSTAGTHPARTNTTPDKRNPQKTKEKTSKPARSASAAPARKSTSVIADPETLAAIRRFFPNVRAEFVSELRAALNGHRGITDHELAAAVEGATIPEQYSWRLYLQTVPQWLHKAHRPNPRNPKRETLPPSGLPACECCQDSGLKKSAAWKTTPELRELIKAGRAAVCDCNQGKTLEELCRED